MKEWNSDHAALMGNGNRSLPTCAPQEDNAMSSRNLSSEDDENKANSSTKLPKLRQSSGRASDSQSRVRGFESRLQQKSLLKLPIHTL